VTLTPEARALVRTVFERSLDRVEDRVDHLRVRLMSDRDGIQCRAHLTPRVGAPFVTVATRASMVDAVLASASALAGAVERRASTRRHRLAKRGAVLQRRAARGTGDAGRDVG
jgi:hypothetical protein